MLVVDASVIVKSVVPEAGSEAAVKLINTPEEFLIPAHALAEVGEAIARKVRTRLLTMEQMQAITSSLPRRFNSVPLTRIFGGAVEISVVTGASVYDCLYVALAVAENCRLVTADGRLIDKMAGTSFAGLLTPLDSFSPSP
jgi:predicted nucleic acid-binding protein